MDRLGVAAIATLLILSAACHKAPATYRLVSRGQTPILVPPGVSRPDLQDRVFVAQIAPGKGPCALERQPIRLDPLKKKIRVTVNPDGLARQEEANWLGDWALRAEAQGCIAPGEGQNLATRIVESVPLDSRTAFRLLHPSGRRTVYEELGPENRIQVITPILRYGAAETTAAEIAKVTGDDASITVDLKQSPDVIGFKTVWFGLQSNSKRPGYHFVALSAERNVQGSVERVPATDANYFRFASDAAFYRLGYKFDSNEVTAIVIAGQDRQDLDRRTKAVGTDPAACARESGLCLVLPRRFGINPFLVVSANGKDLTVPIGATVETVLRRSGVAKPEAVIPQLRVSRLHGGRLRPVEFDHGRPDILNLTLMGLEQIAW